MATKRKERSFEQKRKAIFSVMSRYKRRVEYFFIATFIFIFLGYTSNAIKTNDYSCFSAANLLAYRAFDQIIENILPLTAIFLTFGAIFITLSHPKLVKVMIFAIAFPLFLFILVFPKSLATEYINEIPNIIDSIRNFFLMNNELILICITFILLNLLIFRRTRKRFVKFVKYSIEFYIVSMLIYFSGFYKNLNLLNLFKDYWRTFKNGYTYLENISNVVVLVILVLVFYLIFSSIGHSLEFGIKEYLKGKIDLNRSTFNPYSNSRNSVFKMLSKSKIKKQREKVFKNTQLFQNESECTMFKRQRNFPTLINYSKLPIIGVCIPAHNEELTILKTVKSVKLSNYPAEKLEIIVVSDGSTDNTEKILIEEYQMVELSTIESYPYYSSIAHKPVKKVYCSRIFPNIRLVIKENGGKFDALNVGLQYFSPEVQYVSMIDADTILDSSSLRVFATKALESPNIVALSGAILPKDEFKWYEIKKLLLTVWQYFDYLCAFHISRASLSLSNAMMIVSGAFGFFKRDALLGIGGYKESLGEDIFLTLELQQQNGSVIKYVPQAVAYTQVPTTLKMLRKQRMRWFKGLTESLSTFKRIWVKKPKMLVSYSEFKIIEWDTPLLAPIGIIILIANPEMLNNIVFKIAISLAIITPLIQGIIALFIESIYRPVKWWKLIFLPVQILMAPLVVLWRNDALLDMSSRDWEKVKRY